LLSGEVRVPASKSLLHRGLFCAALAGDLALCELPPEDEMSDDVRATLDCAKKLLQARTSSPQRSAQSQLEFDCRESGTTLRLLIPILAALGISARVTGSGRLPQRPLGEYAEMFFEKDTRLSFPADNFLPLQINGRLKPGAFRIRGDISSQYVSGLLMALPLLNKDSYIFLTTPLESKPYVDMTLAVLGHFGISAHKTPEGWHVPGWRSYHSATPYAAEPDFSQAAFWLLAKHIGNPVAVSGLCHATAQGDSVFASLLGKAEVDVSDCPDLLPALAGAAAFAPGKTLFTNAARLRLKESDRLESTRAMLGAFGVACEITSDTMTVHGAGPDRILNSCTVDSANDHRIVMTAAMLSTRASGPVTIQNPEAVNKSYPRFFTDIASCGGDKILDFRF
jgi:5-enolpyruvylshikimate-3-phosphate synthase